MSSEELDDSFLTSFLTLLFFEISDMFFEGLFIGFLTSSFHSDYLLATDSHFSFGTSAPFILFLLG